MGFSIEPRPADKCQRAHIECLQCAPLEQAVSDQSLALHFWSQAARRCNSPASGRDRRFSGRPL